MPAVIAAVVLSALHTVWLVYEETVWGHLGTSISAASLVSSALALLLLLLVYNTLVARRKSQWRLKPAELMVMFTMLTISSVMAGFDLTQNLPPILMLPFYEANEANR